MISMIEEVIFYLSFKFISLGIAIERNKFVISAISEFKELSKKELLENLNVRYEGESGADGGNILKIFT